MTWPAILDLIAQEAGAEVAARIEERVRYEYGGMAVYIRRTQEITRHDLDAAAPGRPKEAARKLGIHPATAYRILRQPIIR
jgi:transcriptional regulator of acetoin/glycerol metabolism